MLFNKINLRKRGRRNQWVGYLYILPWLIGFLIFQAGPLFASLYFSFTDYSIIGDINFVGLRNYLTAFTSDVNFIKSLRATLLYVFGAVPLKLSLALLMALILNSKLKGIYIFRTAYYLPSIMGASVAVAILWRFMFMKSGYINSILSFLGFRTFDWIGNPSTALFVIILISVWQFGFAMVLYLAALKDIPTELYESASIDGAGPFRRFFSITLPMISPVIFFTIVMQLIAHFQDFTAPMIVTRGGPLRTTYLYGLFLYDNAFKFFKMGYASALSWILFIIIAIITGIIFKFSNVLVYYRGGDNEE